MMSSIRRILSLNRGWFFTTEKPKKMIFDAYQLTKTGACVGAAAMSYDDHNWKRVNLPHDFVVNQELDASADNYNGYLNRPDCWYRRYFYFPKQLEGKRVIIHFEGISGQSNIYLNGCLIRQSHSSFCGVNIDISDYILTGKSINVLSVYMNHQYPEGWWYQGGGLYRSVWIEVTEPICFNEQDLKITTVKKDNTLWEIMVAVPVLSRYGEMAKVRAEAFIENEKCYAMTECRTGDMMRLCLRIDNPRLWDVGEGNLYTLKLSLTTGTELADCIYRKIGFREIKFDAENGFILNGKSKKIYGLCFHEDEGNLGWAIDETVYERRIQHLITMGGNAYRCSHNAPDPILLDLCDRYGILVMDEVRKFDSSECGMRELSYLIRRDRNHPSIVIWSLGNEENIQGTPCGKKIAISMKMLVDKLDGTRPVTLAMHQDIIPGGAADAVDVIGVNYNHEKLMDIRRLYPNKPFIGSEVLNLADEIVENGNMFSGSVGADETLKFAEQHAFYAGTFGWAGADYRGEHRNLAFFTDACPLNCNGNLKDGFYRYQARWSKVPVLHICGHWNPDSYAKNEHVAGRKVKIISNLPYIKVYINNELTAEFKMNDSQQTEIVVPYTQGEICAEGFDDGNEGRRLIKMDRILTSGLAHHFDIYPEKEKCPADGKSRVTCWIEVKDQNGVQVPMAAHNFRVECDGDAEIVCTDNADPYCSCFPDVHEMGLYKGRGKVVLKSGKKAGKIKITVSGDGVLPASCEVMQTEPENQMQELESVESPYINDWFVSRIYNEKPDIYEYTSDDNYSFWRKSLERYSMVEQGLPFFYTRGGGYVIYCMEPNMPLIREGETGEIVFEEITGSCEILVSMRDYDNRILKRYYLQSDEEQPRSLSIGLPGVVSDDRLIIKVIIKGTHSKCGVTGPVRFA